MVVDCWGDHGCFVDGTPEGRRATSMSADASCLESLDSLERRGYWRGEGSSITMRGQTYKRGREGLHKSDDGGIGVKCRQRQGAVH